MVHEEQIVNLIPPSSIPLRPVPPPLAGNRLFVLSSFPMKPSPSPDFHVRRAGPGDVPLLVSLGTRTFQAAFGPHNDPQDMEAYLSKAFSPEGIAAEVADPDSLFLLAHDPAFHPEHPVGYAKLARRSRTPPGVRGERPVELARFYLEPDAIGYGYGAALMRVCLEEACRACHDVAWLGVWEHNHRALRFYERCGFRAAGRTKFVLGRDVQFDIVMVRQIP